MSLSSSARVVRPRDALLCGAEIAWSYWTMIDCVAGLRAQEGEHAEALLGKSCTRSLLRAD